MDGLVAFTLDTLIAELQRQRQEIGHDVPVRFADGYDNALTIHCSSHHTEPTGWDGEPDGEFLELS